MLERCNREHPRGHRCTLPLGHIVNYHIDTRDHVSWDKTTQEKIVDAERVSDAVSRSRRFRDEKIIERDVHLVSVSGDYL